MRTLNHSLGLMSKTMRMTMRMAMRMTMRMTMSMTIRMRMSMRMMSCSNHFNHLKQILGLECYK